MEGQSLGPVGVQSFFVNPGAGMRWALSNYHYFIRRNVDIILELPMTDKLAFENMDQIFLKIFHLG